MTQANKVVAFVIPSLTGGGAEHQTVNQLNYLVERGYKNVRLLILSRQHPLLKEVKLAPHHVHCLTDNSIITIDDGFIKCLPRITKKTAAFIKENKVTDIIAILPMAHVVCRLAKGWLKFRYGYRLALNTYYRAHANEASTVPKKIFNKINSYLAYLTDDRSLFISQAVYKNNKENIFVRNPLVVANSLPGTQISSEEGLAFLEDIQLLTPNRYLILVPGRLQIKKGHALFIDAFETFVNREKLLPANISVIVAGDGPLRDSLQKKLQQKSMESYFYFNGYTDNRLLLSLYKCVNLVAIPSLHEGFGNVAIEGLMQGSVMLVSNTGGLSEIIRDGDNGYQFESGNITSLTEKLVWLYHNRHRELLDRQILYNDFAKKYTLEGQMSTLLSFCGLS